MKTIRQNVCPVLAALIWGLAFSAQSDCASKGMQPFTFNMLRSAIACVTLIIVAIAFSGGPKKLKAKLSSKGYLKKLVLGGFLCGIALCTASYLQQFAIGGSESGKIGFLTSIYIILVPIFGMFVKRKAPFNVWVSVFVALVGMYFLCIERDTGFKLSVYDLCGIACAAVFALHILIIDRFVAYVDCIHLSFAQFAVVTVISGVGALIFEKPSAVVASECIWQLLYVGIMSSGVAYTLQIISQKDSNPTVVTLLLSLESVFSVLGGAVLLNETLSVREYIGCAIMLAAVVFAQLPLSKNKAPAQV